MAMLQYLMNINEIMAVICYSINNTFSLARFVATIVGLGYFSS